MDCMAKQKQEYQADRGLGFVENGPGCVPGDNGQAAESGNQSAAHHLRRSMRRGVCEPEREHPDIQKDPGAPVGLWIRL